MARNTLQSLSGRRKMDDRYTGHSGFPDLVLAHEHKGLIFAELKTDKGRLDPAQITWLRTLDAAGAEAYCWRPSDMQFITQRLLEKAPTK